MFRFLLLILVALALYWTWKTARLRKTFEEKLGGRTPDGRNPQSDPAPKPSASPTSSLEGVKDVEYEKIDDTPRHE